ncbi:MAG: class I SAM-dependent methyltransferase [Desulfobacterales bacterium]|nr:class I SAM-dependent methyltransferase [Desulfobacterales bacterium]
MGKKKNSAIRQVSDTDTYAYMLHLSDFLREPIIHSAIEALQLPQGSLGLDAGCGIGSHTLLLAEAVEPAGHVTGLDSSPELLIQARQIAETSVLSEQVSFREGDLKKILFDDNTFDWVWSVDSLWPGPKEMGCPAEDPIPLVKELARVVKPGGRVAILFWSSQKLLPGYPLLEARLNATSQANAPFVPGERPELHFLRALGWFRDAGLEEATARTFAGDIHSPLSDGVRNGLVSLFKMLWGDARSEVSPEDWMEYQRLCQPGSPDFILDFQEYYAFFTYSLFQGRVAK